MRKLLLRTLCGILFLGLLIASHWFAYHRGEKDGDQDFRSDANQAVALAHLRQLRAQLAILRVMVKHPDRFSQSEIDGVRLRTDGYLKGGKNIVFHHLQKNRDEKGIQEAQSLVDEAQELFAKLPK
jgi:hypothetical protein